VTPDLAEPLTAAPKSALERALAKTTWFDEPVKVGAVPMIRLLQSEPARRRQWGVADGTGARRA
jgi:hypothetical protein